jgi:hypothetical protein
MALLDCQFQYIIRVSPMFVSPFQDDGRVLFVFLEPLALTFRAWL